MAAKLKLKHTLDALGQYAKSLGYWPSGSQWDVYAKQHGYFVTITTCQYTGKSWNELRDDFGFPPREKVYSKEECIAAMQKAAIHLGEFFTKREYEKWHTEDLPSVSQIRRHFQGKFNNAKLAAGLLPNKSWGKEYTDEEIAQALRDCSRDIGKDLFSDDDYLAWADDTRPHIETIRARFGGIANAKKLLGLESFSAGPQYKYTEGRWEIPFMEFLAFALNHDQYEKWAKENNGPSKTAIIDNAGGYEKALLKMVPKYLEKIKAGRIKR
jgi:hypothetical protein